MREAVKGFPHLGSYKWQLMARPDWSFASKLCGTLEHLHYFMVRLQNFEKLTASTIINQKPHLLVHILVLDGFEMTVLAMAICPQRSHFSSSYALETLFALGTDNVRGQISEHILRSRKTVCFSEQIISADKISWHIFMPMEAIVLSCKSFSQRTRAKIFDGL